MFNDENIEDIVK